MADCEVEFVFGRASAQLFEELSTFWQKHQASIQQEIRGGGIVDKSSKTGEKKRGAPRRQPAVIARDASGLIVGIAFVLLRRLDGSKNLGSHAYIYRMYIVKSCRSARLANRMCQNFVDNFLAASVDRDHRCSYLISKNINPRLKNSFIRKYFIKLGFRMLGIDDDGFEVWCLPLKTTYVL
ncbi:MULTISPECIES: hypothetical protein [unclassified Prochlorococcus]|uniref:hypothetical protein n=1 Tax=unclassified Prochlorococcus TaxID=2627481 RepID=UPI00056CBFA7|nr:MULTISPECIES: hypothetical protein [unclassified Prochlorococcus]